MILIDWGQYADTGSGPVWNWGGGEAVAGPGTGEYLERFDVYGGPFTRMDAYGGKLPNIDIYGEDVQSCC